VVSAIPLQATTRLLGDAAPAHLRQRAETLPEGWGAFTVYLGVREDVLPDALPLYNLIARSLTGHGDDGDSVFMSTSPAWDVSRAPTGRRAITLSTHTHARSWFALSREDYARQKATLLESLLQAAERVIPALRSGIEVLEVGTPRTFERFTRRPFGLVGGVPQTRSRSNFFAQSRKSGLDGLWLAGDTIFPGQGTVGVTLSGMLAAESIQRQAGSSWKAAPTASPSSRALPVP
jgi:phytoene dehydrogenase-like protein